MKKIFFLLLISANLFALKAQDYQPNWKSLDARPIPSWFGQAKFGIFVHWGVYSVPAWRRLEPGRYASYAEWYYAKVRYNEKNGGKEFHEKNYGADFEYRDFAPMFKAELFNPDEWAGIFKRSGAKYVVLTTKHHDGYSLWPTKSPYKKNWNAMDVGPERDLVGELTKSVKSAGLKMGLYYSIIEWESTKCAKTSTGYYLPDEIIKKYSIPDSVYVDQHLMVQLKELVKNYQPSLIFADAGEWVGTPEYWKTKEFLAWLYNDLTVGKEVVVNDRFAKGMPGNHGDYYSSEYEDMKEGKAYHPWEESRGIGGSYGFNRAENIDDYNSSAELIFELIDIVSRGGNLLLNVGPTADGRIPVIMQQRLIDIGDWLKVNGDGIYETKKSSLTKPKNGDGTIFFTEKENALFALFNKWSSKLVINLEKRISVKDIYLLGYDLPLKWEKIGGKKIQIEIPPITIDKLPCLHAWSLKINLEK